MTRRPWPETGHPSSDPFLRAIRARLAVVPAPESLRARIGAMLALERGPILAGEPGPDAAR